MKYTGLYTTLKTDSDPEIANDILITELSEVGFDSFAETENGLEAFIPSENYDDAQLPLKYLRTFCSEWHTTEIEPQNWNQTWEENYPPVMVDDQVYIFAHFHPEIPDIKHPIRITPKMSFGTGHHATTELVIQQILETDFNGKSVLDLGTGTGVLAILAHQMGASSIVATEVEDFALENCHENFAANGLSEYTLIDARLNPGDYGKFDVIIANITRNTLIALKEEIFKSSMPETVLIISGFYVSDVEFLKSLFADFKFTGASHVKEKKNWASVKLTKE